MLVFGLLPAGAQPQRVIEAGRAAQKGGVIDRPQIEALLKSVDMHDPAIAEFPQLMSLVEHYFALEAMLGGAPQSEAWGSIVFNTTVPEVGNQWDYYRMRRVLEVGNDTLTLKCLEFVKHFFRYNGYTAGLHELKPHIEQKMPEGDLKRDIMALYKSYASTREGAPAADFTMAGLGGKEWSLSDFAGKVVVIDVWATWCSGCIAKIPSFIALSKKFEGEEVAFITISIDAQEEYIQWKYSLPGLGLLELPNLFMPPGSSFKKDYNITGIPRYMVIDQSGNIVNLYAPAPGLMLERIIDKTLSK